MRKDWYGHTMFFWYTKVVLVLVLVNTSIVLNLLAVLKWSTVLVGWNYSRLVNHHMAETAYQKNLVIVLVNQHNTGAHPYCYTRILNHQLGTWTRDVASTVARPTYVRSIVQSNTVAIPKKRSITWTKVSQRTLTLLSWDHHCHQHRSAGKAYSELHHPQAFHPSLQEPQLMPHDPNSCLVYSTCPLEEFWLHGWKVTGTHT